MTNIKNCECCDAKNSTAAKVLTNEELCIIKSNTVQLELSEGATVFNQDTASSNVYYLKEGIVKLTMKKNNRNQIIKIINSPNYIGLASTLGREVFSFSAIALYDCAICVTNKETYQNLIFQNKYFSTEIIKHLCENELSQYETCVCLLHQNLNGRIAGCLVNMSKNIFKSNKFKINRQDFSDITGHSRENISRAISKFKKDEIINLDGNEIEILDLIRLESICKNG